ncbi:MAG: hypothetical protein PWQ35_366 [Patescibacteria group bacterium]|nr:hypothetical protein [Patescibacteria group bacterium]
MAKNIEKIINEKGESAKSLDAVEIVRNLFSQLMDREKDVLNRRFGLNGFKSETLEKIGGLHKLTRERVRQIEAASISKIKKLENLEEYISDLKEAVYDLLDQHGGVIRRDYLLDILTVIALEMRDEETIDSPANDELRLAYRNHFDFLLSKLLSDDVDLIKKSDKFHPAFKLRNKEVNYLEELADSLLEKVDSLKKTFKTEELIELLKQLEAYNRYQSEINKGDSNIEQVFKSKTFPDKAEIINNNKVLYALLQAIKNLERNKFGEWGIANWHEIKPKTINDKIYLVLKHEGAPLHFTAIADKINEIKFDKKKANAATVHNELILDNRYVLVSRGTYGLKEWQEQEK